VAEENSLQINMGEIKMMVFKKGGKMKYGDRISYDQKWLRVIK
jgi:hypothetical protein